MKTSIWYHTADRQPDKSGYYLAYKSYSMGDNETDTGYYYYNKLSNEWRDSKLSQAHYANVYYWSDADPEQWANDDVPVTKRKTKRPPNPALEIAWNNVQEALRQYEIVKALTNEL
jgi:hypothetical protein